MFQDWVQFEEMVDDDDAGKSNVFEQQKTSGEVTPAKTSLSLASLPEGASVVKCPKATGIDSRDVSCLVQCSAVKKY